MNHDFSPRTEHERLEVHDLIQRFERIEPRLRGSTLDDRTRRLRELLEALKKTRGSVSTRERAARELETLSSAVADSARAVAHDVRIRTPLLHSSSTGSS